MPCCLGGQRTWSATWYSHRHGQAGVGWVKGEWGKKRGAVHLGCQVGVDENFEIKWNRSCLFYRTEGNENFVPGLCGSCRLQFFIIAIRSARLNSQPFQKNLYHWHQIVQELFSLLKLCHSMQGSEAIKKQKTKKPNQTNKKTSGTWLPSFRDLWNSSLSLEWLWKTTTKKQQQKNPFPEEKKNFIIWISNLYWETLSTII